MSTTAAPALSRTYPKARATIPFDPSALWDATNQRWKSGVVQVNVTGITWPAQAAGGAEPVHVRMAAADYSEDHDALELDVMKLVSDQSAGTLSWVQNVAVNYGRLGPSAVRAADGTYDLVYVDLLLREGLASAVPGLVPTVTYSLTFTEDPVYAVMTPGGNVQAADFTLSAGQKKSSHFGTMVTGVGMGAYSRVVCQVASITSAVKAGPSARGSARLVAATTGPMRHELLNVGVSRANQGAVAWPYPPAHVIALNAGKPDRCGSAYEYGTASTHLSYLSVGLMTAPTDDRVSAVVSTRLLYA